MVSIRGRYEYDDGDLTPGNKKEGGLHQNLFDSDGNLKGSARFVPDDPDADDDVSVVYVYDEVAPPVKSRQQEAFEQAVSDQMGRLIDYVIAKAKPHVQRFWEEKARPAIQSKWESRPRWRRTTSRQLRSGGTNIEEDSAVVLAEELEAASAEYRQDMTNSEAQARYVMAIILGALGDEQLNLVLKSDSVLDEGYAELERRLAELSTQQVVRLIESLKAEPSLLPNQLLGLDKMPGRSSWDRDEE